MSIQANALTISLITPNYNGADYLVECLDSIEAQQYPALDHVVVDGGSDDESMAIIEARLTRFAHVICEPDQGHADALNKGFARTEGEIMGWLNSDDMLHPGCLETVERVFRAFPSVAWITGRASSMNVHGELQYVGPARPWSRSRFLRSDPSWIQQESTFWRRSLWDAAGGRVDDTLSVANDFELWSRFFRHAELHTVDRMLGCFRIRPGQRSVAQSTTYRREADAVLARELDRLDPEHRERLQQLTEDTLRRDDPPIISLSELRTSRQADLTHAHPRPAPCTPPLEAPPSSISLTAKRNWRFIVGATVIGAVLAMSAVVLEPLRVWIALVGGVLASLSATALVALKARRILSRIEHRLAEALAGRAEAELRQQSLELELDRLSKLRPNSVPDTEQ
ncbi:glycosyltransferase [Maricaulaceae bacterium EIL42A08]|nr:glycosyltransferase [Maricaulaceae bacterium EIL42A08]